MSGLEQVGRNTRSGQNGVEAVEEIREQKDLSVRKGIKEGGLINAIKRARLHFADAKAETNG